MVLFQHCFPFRTTLFFSRTYSFECSLQKFQTDLVDSSTQYSLVIQNTCSIKYPVFCHHYCTSVLSQLSSCTMVYFILRFKSFSTTFLVAMSANYIPPLHQPILCIFQFSQFLTKCTLLETPLVCLVSLPFCCVYG